MNRKTIFDLVHSLLGRGFSQKEIELLDQALDGAQGDPTTTSQIRARTVS